MKILKEGIAKEAETRYIGKCANGLDYGCGGEFEYMLEEVDTFGSSNGIYTTKCPTKNCDCDVSIWIKTVYIPKKGE